ncbi:MAG: heat-inducible transcription repressor HrcA [Clostridia bacterium]|nr:heat-inducible transcription repressor HrcA [Clostridia bacterium]
MEINDRKKKILKAIIDTYISSGEPVGSKYITEHIDFPVSSATVRNEMSELEEMGFLEQPHTSAGRIPSSLGYRLYVDNLMNRYNLTLEEIGVIDELLNAKMAELNSIVEEAAHLFSDTTNYAAVAITSNTRKGSVKRFDGILIDSYNILIVMITSFNHTQSRQIKTSVEIDTGTLQLILRVLNESLADRRLDEINIGLIMDIESKLGAYREIFSPIVRAVYEVISQTEQYRVYTDGISNLLSYPEFADVIKAKSLLSALEEKTQLVRMLQDAKGNDINVYIGDHGFPGSMNDTSFIFHTFDFGGKVVGAVGLIGPRRMDYSKVVAQLEYFTRHLISSDYSTKKQEKGNENGKGKEN